MRRVLVFVVPVAVCLSLCGCESSPSPCECSPQSAVTLVWASYDDDRPPAATSRDGWTWLYGVVLADPLPALQSVHVNDEEFSDPYHWTYEGGYIEFGDIEVYSESGPMEVTVRTSAGDVGGTVSLPDEITYLEFSESETLALGESLTVSWPGQEADFYYFELSYEWGDWEYAYVETVVSGNSVTIDGSFFSHDGVIESVWIQPSNGPLPRPGATGNMSGYGSGYLYYSRDGYWMDPDIQVGDGIERRTRSQIARSFDMREAKAQTKIRQMLGLPTQLDR